MSFLRTAVFLGALSRLTRGDDAAGDIDTTGFFHVPADLSKERIAFNEYFTNLLSKANAQDAGDINFGRNADGVLDAKMTPFSDETSTPEPFGPEDSWSILWYFASFSGLIVFFLVVSCSEWCCRKHIRRNNPMQQSATATPSPSGGVVPEAPPPAYDLFAPPSYESLTSGSRTKEKSEYDVYVVPVHALSTVLAAGASEAPEDAPPSYSAINMNFIPDQNRTETRTDPNGSV